MKTEIDCGSYFWCAGIMGVGAGGPGVAAAPLPQVSKSLKFFGQNAHDSRNSI